MESQGTVLLVEDNAQLNEANSRALRLRGYDVLAALTLEEARRRLSEAEPDIILLDIMLPDGDGLAFCSEIRGSTAAHIFFLTARTEHEDLLKGFMEGGDDYITKPFHPEELLARIEAAMRRRRHMEKPMPQRLAKGALTLDLAASQAYIGARNLALTPKEFSLLFILFQHAGKTLNKAFLYEEVWKQPLGGDSTALWRHMSRLKHKLEEAGAGSMTILTTRGEGYSLEQTEER